MSRRPHTIDLPPNMTIVAPEATPALPEGAVPPPTAPLPASPPQPVQGQRSTSVDSHTLPVLHHEAPGTTTVHYHIYPQTTPLATVPTHTTVRRIGCLGALARLMVLGGLALGGVLMWHGWQPSLSVADLAIVREHLAGSMDTQVFAVTGHASAPPDTSALDLTAVAPIGELPSPPSITAAQIDTVLESYGSPAVGTGPIFYEQGVAHGIDPAYALAFFVHESSAGTHPGWAGLKPDGSTTHNVGNIICAGYPTCFGRFRDYPSWEAGITDWYRLIQDEYIKERRVITVAEIIPIYAPSIENNVPAYVQAVEELVTTWRAEATSFAADPAATPTTLPPLQIQEATFQPATGEVTGWLQNDTDAALVLPAGAIAFVVGEDRYQFDTLVELAPHQRQAFAIEMPVTITADQPLPAIRMEVSYDRGIEIVEVPPAGEEE